MAGLPHPLSRAGVYTMAFLSVMGFFAAGTLVLRIKRPDLERPFVCPLCVVLCCVVLGVEGLEGTD